MQERYQEIYQSLDYGPIGTARGLGCAIWITSNVKPCKILCVGSGNPYEAVWLWMNKFDVTTFDYTAPPLRPGTRITQVIGDATHLPFPDNSFDFLMCCEMLEHIPELKVNKVLHELLRVSSIFEFTVDTEDDPPYHTHLTIKDRLWWSLELAEVGFVIDYFDRISYSPCKFITSDGKEIGNLGLAFEKRGYRVSAHKAI